MTVQATFSGNRYFTVEVTDGTMTWLGSPGSYDEAMELIQGIVDMNMKHGNGNPDTIFYIFAADEVRQVVAP